MVTRITADWGWEGNQRRIFYIFYNKQSLQIRIKHLRLMSFLQTFEFTDFSFILLLTSVFFSILPSVMFKSSEVIHFLHMCWHTTAFLFAVVPLVFHFWSFDWFYWLYILSFCINITILPWLALLAIYSCPGITPCVKIYAKISI